MRLDAQFNWDAYTLFEHEAQALQRLNHPRIPRFLAFAAEPEQQRVILVQEAIAGESLRTRIQQRWKVTEVQARKLASEILELLMVLHQSEPALIHRDIKPENLILDAANQVYLIDFGAAHEASPAPFTVAGSLAYMPPEQLQGKAIPASDLYALGMTLIELLSGSALELLPRQGLYLDFHSALHVSESFKRWLEHLVTPYASQRFASAAEAKTALTAPEHLPAILYREFTRPSHGKQELTPFIWLHESPEQLSLEITGQKLNLSNFVFFLGSTLFLVGIAFLPLALLIANDFWIRFLPRGNPLLSIGWMLGVSYQLV